MTRNNRLLARSLVFICLLFLIFSAGNAGECVRSDFVIAIDAGHTKKNGGATSATGVSEYVFNRTVAESLIQELKKGGFTRSFLIGDSSLNGRAATANRKNASLLLSIHHDSVQPRYLSRWIHGGCTRLYCDKYGGFSIFYSQENGAAEQSILFATLLATEILKEGLRPSLHHAEKIEGENRELVDENRGIYRYDGLAVLKGARMPAILLECGIIVNRQEEQRLNDPAYRMKIVDAIQRAATAYCTTQK
ncbi:MAG: N-acetylmuramoyl-L-alanine amidase AmiA precursor [Syntrophorhabdus sp. PtaU1.Bin153]|nr:MAG: N-acetylmuramoyl-L-alanine amidase AmiA precursor [Syntrophorhabdus sp. PtaU1.Bin153]